MNNSVGVIQYGKRHLRQYFTASAYLCLSIIISSDISSVFHLGNVWVISDDLDQFLS